MADHQAIHHLFESGSDVVHFDAGPHHELVRGYILCHCSDLLGTTISIGLSLNRLSFSGPGHWRYTRLHSVRSCLGPTGNISGEEEQRHLRAGVPAPACIRHVILRVHWILPLWEPNSGRQIALRPCSGLGYFARRAAVLFRRCRDLYGRCVPQHLRRGLHYWHGVQERLVLRFLL